MTAIEWTDVVWNPTTGCDRVSPGCDHCYALTMAKRLKGMGSAKYQTDGNPVTSGPGFGLAIHTDALSLPLRWRKPRRVFVNSMSDLFHDEVPQEFIAQVFAVMARTPQHTYQILTKRHGRLRSLVGGHLYDLMVRELTYADNDGGVVKPKGLRWPLPNVWLGVSVENQQWADIRIPALLDTPAMVRWLSCEPMLGPIDLSKWLGPVDWPSCWGQHSPSTECAGCIQPEWVVVGGESGPGARPMHPDWARQLRDQCVDAGVPFFFKQWGEWQDGSHNARTQHGPDHVIVADGRHEPWLGHTVDGGRPGTSLALARLRSERGTDRAVVISRVGKKAAGRLLDGRTWDEYPTTPTDRKAMP